jgi:hypothetical protein
MPQTVIDAILDRVKQTLTDATDAGPRVERSREEPFSKDEVPAIKIRRADSEHPRVGRDLCEITMRWGVECHVRGAQWEKLADALHAQAHAALFADEQLNTLARYLLCATTNCDADPADQTAGRLVAIYEARVTVTRADLTTALN